MELCCRQGRPQLLYPNVWSVFCFGPDLFLRGKGENKSYYSYNILNKASKSEQR